jgi:hypothetical protein
MNCGGASPLFTFLLVVSGPKISKFPAVLASKIPNEVTSPQFAVGGGKMIAALLDVVPLDPVDGPVVVAPTVLAQLVVLLVTLARA